jgi:hypothetical protein
MALLAYAVAAALTSRKNAVLAAAATLALLVSVPGDVAWTSLAQLCCWASLAVGVRAMFSAEPHRTRRAWLGTGFAAGLTLAFHQVVAAGALLGWLVAFAYRELARRAGKYSPDVAVRRELGAFGSGAGVAAGVVLLLALAAGGSLGAFFRNVFADAIVLAGSWRALAENLATILALQHEAYPSTLVLTSVAIAVGLAAARRSGLSLGDEPSRPDAFGTLGALAIALAVLVGFGGALVLLATSRAPLPLFASAVCMSLAALPAFGWLFGGAFFIANWLGAPDASESRRAAHAFNALLLCALSASAVSGLAFRILPESRYVEHPSIAVGFACLFIAFRRARLGWLSGFALLGSLATLFGPELNRALVALSPAPQTGVWAGLRVSYRGEELLRAAERVQALAGRADSVLVLPEDAHLAALFGRPRPPLRGGLVFVHTYPERLVDGDLAALRAHPPKVIVIHPRREAEWRKLFATWATGSAAAEVTAHAILHLLPERYVLDSTFRTIAFEDMGQLDIWVRRDLPPAEAP